MCVNYVLGPLQPQQRFSAWGPGASAASGNWSEMQILRTIPGLLSKILWGGLESRL